jgi:hypothetical protein
MFSEESQALLIRERLDSHCRAGEALHLIAGLTFCGFGKSKPPSGSSPG